MKQIQLFSNHDTLCNPSIVEYNKGMLGIARRWYDKKYLLSCRSYLFRLNEQLRLEQFLEVPFLNGLNDYTLYRKNEGVICLVFGQNKSYTVSISNGCVSLGKLLNTKPIDGLKKKSSFHFCNKNFSPLQFTGEDLFVYSINPFILVKLVDDTFHKIKTDLGHNPLLPSKPHGGTRFIKFSEDEAIGMFHTYKTYRKKRRYKTYIMTVSTRFPYTPLRVSSKPFIDAAVEAKNMCNQDLPWLASGSKVVFERGLARFGNDFMVSYGLQDNQSILLKATPTELDSFLDKRLDGN
ncbi:MAG: hypothetical protein ACOWW1_11040 [archaeon]|nr:hypothetical protein [Candidatus Bathyarchaeum sp.]